VSGKGSANEVFAAGVARLIKETIVKLNAPETLQRLTVAEMETVLSAVDAHWDAKGQYTFSITNPRLLTPLFAMLVTALGYGFVGDVDAALPYFRELMIFGEIGFFAIFCMVAGQYAWNHWSRNALIKSARDIGVDVSTLDEDALERWVVRPLRAKQYAGTTAD